jgi:outer membrane protein assembly factor BamA
MNQRFNKPVLAGLLSTGLLAASLSLVLTLVPPAQAQSVTIQANPVFSTPVPKNQPLGPKGKAYDGDMIEYTQPQQPASTQGQVEGGYSKIPPAKSDIGTPLDIVTLEKVDYSQKNIGNVSFEGNKYTRDFVLKEVLENIEDRQGEALDTAWLDSEIGRINKQQKFKLKGFVSQNEQNPEQADLHFDVYERQPWQIALTADNQGRPGAGMYRGGAQLINENLLGIGDKLTLSYVGSSRSHRAGAVYDLPLNTHGGKFQAKYFYHRIKYDPQYTPGNDKIIGEDNVVVVSLEQPLDKRRIYTPYISTLWRQVTLDRHFPAGKRRVLAADPRPISVGMKYKRPYKYGSTFLNVAGVVGGRWMGGDSQFFRMNAVGKQVIKLPKKNKLVVRGRYQYSPDAMPPVQQIGISGVGQVRGYTEGLIYGDRGYFVSTEHHWPVPFIERVNPYLANRLEGVTFFDIGQAWQDKSSGRFVPGVSNDSDRTLLMSVGAGVRYNLSRFAQGFCDVAYGIGRRNELELGGSPTFRVHFGVRSNLLPAKFKKHNDERVSL